METRMSLRYQGTLEKQGRTFRGWRKYWFVLKDEQLTYVREDKVASKPGAIDMSQAQSVRSTNVKHVIEIISHTRTHVLRAENAVQMEKWINSLQQAIVCKQRVSVTSTPSMNRMSCQSISDEENSTYDTISSPKSEPNTPMYRKSGAVAVKQRSISTSAASSHAHIYEEVYPYTTPEELNMTDVDLNKNELIVKETDSGLGSSARSSSVDDSATYSVVNKSHHQILRRVVCKTRAGESCDSNASTLTAVTSIGSASSLYESIIDGSPYYDDVFVNSEDSKGNSVDEITLRGSGEASRSQSSSASSERYSSVVHSSYPPIPELPYPRIELTWESTFDSIRLFIANDRGPDEFYMSAKKGEIRDGSCIMHLKEFLETLHNDNTPVQSPDIRESTKL